MASTVIANAYRARLAAFHAGGAPLSAFGYMAFGDGGHDENDKPTTPDADTASLAHELMRVALHDTHQPTPFSVSCEGRIEPGQLEGAKISEAALLDLDGNLVAIKTFAPKIRESDELYQVFIEPLF